MTRQQSERGTVPKGRRKTVPTASAQARGGKAPSVFQQSEQLGLFHRTAEDSGAKASGAVGGADSRGRGPATRAAPKRWNKEETAPVATMAAVVAGLDAAFQNVAANKGAPGPDRVELATVRAHWGELRADLAVQLSVGQYRPGAIRRVQIPKADGGQRDLGIPNVVDRVVQEAVRLALEPLYEPTFHDSSHGFRAGRSCHTAIAQARAHLEAGYEWVVDLDLEKFFDRVCHQRLMARLALRVQDRELLVLVGRMLRARVVLPDGVVVSNEQGVPQGGPLSPLLSNVVLDELDRELARRELRFVRYADDCNIYVQSERAGQRVMASVTRFLERRLRLKVNAAKSAVARPEERHFLGFSLRREPLDGSVEVGLSKRSRERLRHSIRERTPRNHGGTLASALAALNAFLLGWTEFFWIVTQHAVWWLRVADAHVRRRLRAMLLKDWKSKRTIARKLIALGVKPKTAWSRVYEGRKSLWALSATSAVERGLRNAYFAERGLVSLEQRWLEKHPEPVAPAQLALALG